MNSRYAMIDYSHDIYAYNYPDVKLICNEDQTILAFHKIFLVEYEYYRTAFTFNDNNSDTLELECDYEIGNTFLNLLCNVYRHESIDHLITENNVLKIYQLCHQRLMGSIIGIFTPIISNLPFSLNLWEFWKLYNLDLSLDLMVKKYIELPEKLKRKYQPDIINLNFWTIFVSLVSHRGLVYLWNNCLKFAEYGEFDILIEQFDTQFLRYDTYTKFTPMLCSMGNNNTNMDVQMHKNALLLSAWLLNNNNTK